MHCARGECVVACDRVRLSSWKESNQGLLIADVISQHISCQKKRNRFQQQEHKKKKEEEEKKKKKNKKKEEEKK